jgi:hypothetical protein
MKRFLAMAIAMPAMALACSSTGTVPREVSSFLALLTGPTPPTLAEYKAYYGESAEDEVQVLLHECAAQNISDSACARQSKEEAQRERYVPSRYLSWVRRCFGVTGAPWKVDRQYAINNSAGKQTGAMFIVTLNSIRMELQFVDTNYRYDGLSVAIYEINGATTGELLSRADSACVR